LKEESLKIYEQISGQYPDEQAATISNLGVTHWSIGNYDTALELTYKALEILRNTKNDLAKAWVLNFLGNYHYDLQNYEQALEYYKEALSLAENTEDIAELRAYIGLTSTNIKLENLKDAEIYALRSISIYMKGSEGDYGLSRVYLELGNIALKKNNFIEAEYFYDKSLEIRKRLGVPQAEISSLMVLGNLYFQQSNFEKSLFFLENALGLAKKINSRAKMHKIHLQLSELFEKTNEAKKALHHFKKFYELKSETLGNQSDMKVQSLQAQMEAERSEKEAEIQRLRNVELQAAYEEIEDKNKQITESINYAQRIQEAMLPSVKELIVFEEKVFVLFKPRDIVSGDFYWFAQKENNYIIAIVDCTGHGVPGAFMSMIGDSLLNQIVHDREEHRPAKILEAMHKGIRSALKQNENENRDGMDMTVVNIDANAQTIAFAGAKNPLIYIKNNELHQIKGDKFGVGGEQREVERVFTEHQISVEEDLTFYMYSDGFQDQFGGKNNRKFMSKPFRELLFSVHHLPIQEQKKVLEKTFEDWKAENAQVDDVLLIGVHLEGVAQSEK